MKTKSLPKQPIALVALTSFSIGILVGSTMFSNWSHRGPLVEAPQRLPLPSDLGEVRSGNNKGVSSVWDVVPLQHTEHTEFFPGIVTDAFNPIHNYMRELSPGKTPVAAAFDALPRLQTWPHYFEMYHNHLYRFRGKDVVFMEVGVQSGGKIPLLRDLIGPGFRYVGIDINDATKRYAGADWVSIEIGDSASPEFWSLIRQKYPHVDVFLDDGGHTMRQQMVTLEEMLPHVQPEGVYICEDLATSWSAGFGGIHGATIYDRTFLDSTMVGLVYRTMDWLQAGWRVCGSGIIPTPLSDMPDDMFPETWWKKIPEQVKHIHFYNQAVVYGTCDFVRHISLFTPEVPLTHR